MSNANHLPSVKYPLPEITIKVIFLSIILALLLAASNTYLALKIGILTSASIPAAIISMGVLRLFKKSNILENNLVQTAGSAGQAVAGGIVYTIPALVIIRYWTHFNFFENFIIALTSGVLGVLFSIPFRRALVSDPTLRFPEGKAIAEVLLAGSQKAKGIREMILGGAIGGAIEFVQSGIKIAASEVQIWFSINNTIFGFGAGFSAALIGAGYLVGVELAVSLLIGAVIGWFIGIPIASNFIQLSGQSDINSIVANLWSTQIRFIGLGAMFITLIYPLYILLKSIFKGVAHFSKLSRLEFKESKKLNSEKDIPTLYLLLGILIVMGILYVFLQNILPFFSLGFSTQLKIPFLMGSLFYILFFGFIISAVAGYFSGLLGVAASPGSAIVTLGLLIIALILKVTLDAFGHATVVQQQEISAIATAIILGTIVAGSAAVSIDNIQDLKVGYILGATPWKQQVMLLIGVACAAAVTPLVMELLFQVYGIANILPGKNMDPTQALPAPPAALIAIISQGVFYQQIPWHLISIGAAIGLLTILGSFFLNRFFKISISSIGIAIGIYLPLASSMALVLGGLLSWWMESLLKSEKRNKNLTLKIVEKKERGIIFACGLVAGAALMNIALAIPFFIFHNPDILNLMPGSMDLLKNMLGITTLIVISFIFYKVVSS